MKGTVAKSFIMTSITLGAFVSCSSTNNKSLSEIRHLGYKQDSSLRLSVLAFTASQPSDGFMFAYGTGFIVAEDSKRYIGVTNQHVWHQCNAIRNTGDCLIAISKDDSETQYLTALAKPLLGSSGKHVTGFNKDVKGGKYLDYAFFFIEKSPEIKLGKLRLDVREAPTDPQLVSVAGFPGGTIRQGEDFVRSTLVTSSGFGFAAGVTSDESITFNGGRPEDPPDVIVLTSHLRGGNSGGPVLSLRGNDWVVIGIASEGVPYESRTVTIDSNRSAGKDAYARWGRAVSLNSVYLANKTEMDWSIFDLVDDSSKGAGDLSKSIRSASYLKEVVDGEVNFNFELEFVNELDSEYLYLNGIHLKYADAKYAGKKLYIRVSNDNITNSNYPDLVIEYMKPQSQSLAMCYKNNYSDQEKKLQCFPRLSYEVRYLDSKSE